MNENQPNTLPPEYFDHVYQANRDPQNFETSLYERAKCAATLAALPRPHYAEAFEIGCSLGVLTAQLALHCGHLLAVDVSEADLARAADLLIAALNPGGQLLLVHWTPPVHDYPLTGDEVPQFFS